MAAVAARRIVLWTVAAAAAAALVTWSLYSPSRPDSDVAGTVPAASRSDRGEDAAPRKRRERTRAVAGTRESDDGAADPSSTAEGGVIEPEVRRDAAARQRSTRLTRADLAAILARPDEPPRPHFEWVDDTSTFAKYYPEPAAETPSAEGGARIVFPAGCFRWNPREPAKRPAAPAGAIDFTKDVAIEGAGMDETLVVLTNSIEPSGAGFPTVTLRNLTVHCNDHALVAIRSAAAAIHLDRCRVIGFDAGDHGAQILRGGAAVFWAEQSRFETGFGSAPGSAVLFNSSPGTSAVRSITLARFDRCVLQGPFAAPQAGTTWFPRHQTVLFTACELLDLAPADREWIERPGAFVRLDDCKVTYAADSIRSPRARRDVSELNSSWRVPE